MIARYKGGKAELETCSPIDRVLVPLKSIDGVHAKKLNMFRVSAHAQGPW
jgi:hypothetical protein